MLLLDLPTEILANILQTLPYGDIISCRETCRILQSIVDKSIAVQYSLELGASGKLDDPSYDSLNAEKLVELRKVNRRWLQFQWKHRVGPIPVRNFASVYEFTGGCFFQDINASYRIIDDSPPSSISWLPFPGSDYVGVHKWGHNQFDFRPADICVDVDRDLLVVIERQESFEGSVPKMTCIAHFRTISTNEPHPDATSPSICVCSTSDPSIVDHGMIIQLGGDHLGLLLSRREIDPRRSDNLHLWDWTKGIRKSNVFSSYGCRWDSFCFLADDVILLPDTGSEELNIYLFNPEADSLRHAISLQLPETKMKNAIHYMSVRCEPIVRSPSACYQRKSPMSRRKSFKTDPQAAIVIVALEYALPTESASVETEGFLISLPDPQVFAIKRKKLVELAREAKLQNSPSESSGTQSANADPTVPRLPSQQWIQFTRWGLAPIPPRWVCYVQGSRYISIPDRPWGSGRKVGLKIYDFNIMQERKAECMGQGSAIENDEGTRLEGWTENEDEDEEIEFIPNEVGIATKISTPTKWPVKAITTLVRPCKINKPELFEEPFITYLPCRLTETEAVFDWDSVVIDEDHVVGLKEEHADSGILESIDVLVF